MDKSQSLSIPKELLGLDDVEILGAKITSSGDIIISVVSIKKEILCHKCNKPCDAHGKGTTIRLRHLSILGRKTYIELTPPRGICKNCDQNPTTTQTLSWYKRNGRYTKPYEDHVLLSMINSTISDVSIKEGISDTAIQNIIDRYIEAKVDWRKIKKLGILGIDEITIKKGYKDYITIITSRVNNQNKILSVIRGKEKAKIKAFFSSIPKKKSKTIIAVCCDMYDGYVNAAREVFGDNVAIVIDRFHVAKLYRKALVALRKKELKRLRKELSEEEYKSLKAAISILVKKQEYYTKQDKLELELLFKYSPALKAAYKMARQLTSIFNTNHKKETANKKITKWINKVQSNEIKCFNTFSKTLTKYKDEVTNYFVDRNTSGFVEGLNNKFKVIKRRCYGIVNIKNYFQRIFLDLEGYNIFLNNQAVTA
jgi:transposase